MSNHKNPPKPIDNSSFGNRKMFFLYLYVFLYFKVGSNLENLEKDQEKKENRGIRYKVVGKQGKVNKLFHECRLMLQFLYDPY